MSITDAADVGALTIINASPVDISDTCPDCSTPGTKRDHVQRRLVDLPVVGFPTRLHVLVPRFTCTNPTYSRKIFRASLPCADDGAKMSHRVTRWILQRLAVDRMSVTATAKALGVGWSWSTVLPSPRPATSSTLIRPIWPGCGSSGLTSTCGSTPAGPGNPPRWSPSWWI